MDEPLSSLDAGLRAELRVEIAALVRSTGTTTVYVTHDQIEAMTMADRMAVLRDGVLEDVGTPEQIYEDPATVFVAAFLSSPPINLLQATLWAVEGEGLLLDFGPQRLTLPWNDPRASALISHHGRPVIVGIRPDTLMPIAPGSPAPHGSVLSGQVRALEFHGHEWLAYAEAGIPTVDATEVGRPEAPPPASRTGPACAGACGGVRPPVRRGGVHRAARRPPPALRPRVPDRAGRPSRPGRPCRADRRLRPRAVLRGGRPARHPRPAVVRPRSG
ncbi:hypothetical protein [Actinomadura madurae]